ncbi:MAG: hypothetical protein NTW87_02090 [Planctomycetota bacterium]|nr:hypothetical protein [Planctomycetota bacterium]
MFRKCAVPVQCLLLVPALSALAAQESDGQLLSVEETVKLAKTILLAPANTAYLSRVRKANPAARTDLYSIVADKRQKEYWSQIVGFFAHIGQSDDVPRLVDFVNQRSGLLDAGEASAVQCAFVALGGMAARGVEDARAQLDTMMSPAYWRGKQLRLSPVRPGQLTPEYELVSAVIAGRVAALEKDFPVKAAAVLQEIEGDEQRALMRRAIESSVQAHREAVQMIRDRGGQAPLETPSTPRRAPPPPPRAVPRQPAEIAGAEPRNTDLRTAPKTLDRLSVIIADALKTYERASAALLTDDYATGAQTFADNGKPMVANREDEAAALVKDKLKAMAPSMTITKDLVREIREKALAMGPAEVEIGATTTARETARAAGTYAGVDIDNVTIVRVPLDGSAELARKYMPNHPRTHITLSRKGELVIYMLKKDDRWYWNPFGW